MDSTILILIVVTNLILALILVALIIFVIKYYFANKDGSSKSNENLYHPEIKNRIKEINSLKKQNDSFCPNHRDEIGEAPCAICDKMFCKKCIKPFKALHFCKEHLPLIMKNQWDEVLKVKTSTENPEEGVRLYDLKTKLFTEKNIPIYIETHYKIDVEDDFIETYLVLYGIKDQVEQIKNYLRDL